MFLPKPVMFNRSLLCIVQELPCVPPPKKKSPDAHRNLCFLMLILTLGQHLSFLFLAYIYNLHINSLIRRVTLIELTYLKTLCVCSIAMVGPYVTIAVVKIPLKLSKDFPTTDSQGFIHCCFLRNYSPVQQGLLWVLEKLLLQIFHHLLFQMGISHT